MTYTKPIRLFFVPILVTLGLMVLLPPPVQSQDNAAEALVIVGDDYNVYTSVGLTGELKSLTSDGAASRRYNWPVWSDEGYLAFFCCDRSVDEQVFVTLDADAEATQIITETGRTVIYAAWLPGLSGNASRLAMLVNDVAGTLKLDIVTLDQVAVDAGRVELADVDTIMTGSPLYFHWNTDGTQLSLHVNGDSLEIYDFVTGSLLDSDVASGDDATLDRYQPAQWSAGGDLLFVGADNGSAGTLSVLGEDQQLVNIGVASDDNVAFAWSPDGRYIAYSYRTQNQFGPVTIYDAQEDVLVGTTDVDSVLSFFWSPDSQSIAMTTLEQGTQRATAGTRQFAGQRMQPVQNQTLSLDWYIYRLDSRFSEYLDSYVPTTEQTYMLVYAEQFAVSHQFWSDDSRSITYARVNSDGSRSIVVANTRSGAIDTVADGLFSVWR